MQSASNGVGLLLLTPTLGFKFMFFQHEAEIAKITADFYHMTDAAVARILRTTGFAAVLVGGPDGKTVLDVNEPWLQTCGFTRDEALGSSIALLQGPETFQGVSGVEVKRLTDQCRLRRPVTATLRNFKKDRTGFLNRVTVTPVGGSSFLCVSDIIVDES